MPILLIISSLIRFWKVTLPLGVAMLAIAYTDAKQDRKQYRGYDPMDFTEAEAQQAIRIMVPAHVEDAGGR